MINGYAGSPRLVRRPTGTRLKISRAADYLSILSGAYEEYQSSVIGMEHLRAAIRREPRLDTVLQPSLHEMQQANQSLRQEVMELLNVIIRRIGTLNVDGGRSGD